MILALLTLAFLGVAPAASATAPDTEIVSIEFVGTDSTRFTVDDRRYAGPMTFTLHRDGLAVTERTDIDQYLQGIAEVPFSWPEESLEAQVVAARTYLTRTLAGGRSSDGRTYGFDICATSRCQVYRGVGLVEGPSGDRWRDAVAGTANELVVYEGRAIEAVYSSTFGSRSRANQDVWPSDPVPYLQPVDSPEIGRAPFAEWTVELSGAQFVSILRAGGLEVGGVLRSVTVDDPPEGLGRATVTVSTSGGTDSLLAPALRGVMNRHGDRLYPGSLPADRPDGGSYPEPFLSPTYEITRIDVPPRPIDAILPVSDRIDRDVVRFDGEGWGHGVGMSQWGARIMAADGATHTEILEHYYTGAAVAVVPELVPDEVVVGLAWGRGAMTIDVEGPTALRVNGVAVATVPSGTWLLRPGAGGIVLVALDTAGPAPDLGARPWPR